MPDSLPVKKRIRGLRRVFLAFAYSRAGLLAAWRREAAFRQEVLISALLAPVAWWVTTSTVERALLLGSLGFVLAIELLNSALEAVVDLVSPDPTVLAGVAKDIGSAAVFVSLVTAAAVWLVVLV